MMTRTSALIMTIGLVLSASVYADDWPCWRGTNGNGIAPDGVAPPLEWSEDTNVVWKSKIPGRGHGSPTIVGDRIYLASANESEGTQFVMALDRETGELVWKSDVYENEEWPKIHLKNTHASTTVACDGESLFVTFYGDAMIRVACLDVDGSIRWKKDVAEFDQRYPFGYAASPLLFDGTVIVAAESEAETALVAYDQANGVEVWRTERPQNSSYSSPILLHVGGRRQLLMNGGQEIRRLRSGNGERALASQGLCETHGRNRGRRRKFRRCQRRLSAVRDMLCRCNWFRSSIVAESTEMLRTDAADLQRLCVRRQ